MLAIDSELSLIFATPFLRRILADPAPLNSGLERAILERRRTNDGSRISNIGGWQSRPDLLDWPDPEVKRLKAEIDHSVQKIWALPALLRQRGPAEPKPVTYEAYAWANINQAGHYNMIHMHPGNHLSAVYYVTTGHQTQGREMDGRLELRDPRPASNFCRTPGPLNSGSLLVTPQPGMLVIFPAWIEHLVHPFHGEGHRISIAVNIAITSG
jgi:uncharacterized protein (TIGR02466 family)